jgi:hypothetical protein
MQKWVHCPHVVLNWFSRGDAQLGVKSRLGHVAKLVSSCK